MLENFSPQTQTDVDQLLAAAMGTAQHLLGRGGGFLPFAYALSTDGVISPVDISPRLRAGRTTGETAAAACLAEVVATRSALRAAVLVSDVQLDAPDNKGQGAGSHGDDAVDITLEHVEGVALQVLRPYTRSVVSASVELGAATAYDVAARIWV